MHRLKFLMKSIFTLILLWVTFYSNIQPWKLTLPCSTETSVIQPFHGELPEMISIHYHYLCKFEASVFTSVLWCTYLSGLCPTERKGTFPITLSSMHKEN